MQKKTFNIPVTWEVLAEVEVEAETIEEAVKWLKENLDEVPGVPLGTDCEYIDGSYKIVDGNNGESSIEETVKYLNESSLED